MLTTTGSSAASKATAFVSPRNVCYSCCRLPAPKFPAFSLSCINPEAASIEHLLHRTPGQGGKC
jgi:hypothetical protein